MLNDKDGEFSLKVLKARCPEQYNTQRVETKAEVKAEVKPEVKAEVKAEVKPQAATPTEGEVKYYAQICTLSSKSNPNDAKFGPYKGRIVQLQTPTGQWRCLVEAKDYDEAVRLAAEADKRGFKGAFATKIKTQ